MAKVILRIENPYDPRTLELGDEVSFGRTSQASVALEDSGLSRLHATIFRDGGDILLVDEGSTNGTFLNGQKVSGPPVLIKPGDVIKIGNETRIFVEAEGAPKKETAKPAIPAKPKVPKADTRKTQASVEFPVEKKKLPMVPIAAGASTIAIILTAGIAIFLLNAYENKGGPGKKSTPQIQSQALIPIRVIDPLGGEDPDDLEDIISSWEGLEEQELNLANVDEVKAVPGADTGPGTTKASELNVPIATWQKQKDLAMAPRSSPVGPDPPGTNVPRELFGDGVVKQKAKLAEMMRTGYQQPMDFSDLADKRLKGELIELPMANDWFFLDVGGSAGEEEFTAFDFDTKDTPIPPNSPKFGPLSRLASSFEGQKYDLNNGRDRRQIRIRLLRMFHPRARGILERLAKAYHQRFQKPLRVTSLTRSMDYQISLNKVNANSFMVRGKGSLPPHTSGCAFDLARKHMTADEQNFVMAELAKMENEGILDALREGGANACFHVFIYPDGRPAR